MSSGSGAREPATAHLTPAPSRPARVRCLSAAHGKGRAMTIVLVILGVLIGALAAALLVRRDRARMREELKAISLDVMAQTGASLRAACRTRAAPSRSAQPARWPSAPSRSRASSGPCRRSSGAWRARSRGSSASAARPGRARRDGAPARRGRRHAAARDRQPRLGAEAPGDARLLGRDPAAQRRRDGRHGLALRLRRAVDDPDRRGRAAARHARPAARRQARRGRLEGAARRLPLLAGGEQRRRARAARRAPRPPDARAHRRSSRPRATSASSTRRPSSS